jgi:hypothetical protein
VIVTHGHLAGELLAAAEMIIGPISHIAAVSIGWHDDVDAARDEVQRAITRVSQGNGRSPADRYVWRHADKHRFDVFGRRLRRSGYRSESADGDQARFLDPKSRLPTLRARLRSGPAGNLLAGALLAAANQIRS